MGRLTMPAELEPHERTVLCWPCREEIYPGGLMDEAREAHALLAQTIARFEPVTMIARPEHAPDAAERCGPTVEVVALALDDSWFRDTGPIYVFDGDERVALDFEFNGWGAKFAPWDADAALASAWAERAGHPVRHVPLVFEGGSISVDGAGTGITTMQCLLHPNRNPALTMTEIEDVVCDSLGLHALVWLPYGLALDDDTDGHVDNVAAFVRPGRVLVQGCDDPDEADFVRMDVNRRVVDGHVDGDGERLEVVEVPTLPFVERDGQRVAVPYLNLYVGNGFAMVPTCGHPADDEVLSLIASELPGREVIGLEIGSILAVGGGGIHCVTQQVPAPRRSRPS
ncbi:MAG: agmatine deiminase family protein [Acidimicrobiales bacterium]|nr:agmatine deiminase family protein [Acidimicrobiales bacterium]